MLIVACPKFSIETKVEFAGRSEGRSVRESISDCSETNGGTLGFHMLNTPSGFSSKTQA